MKKVSVLIFFIALTSFLLVGCNHRYRGPKPFMCKVIVTIDGKDVIGRDEGKSLKKALKESVEEACERACDGDDCARKCAAENQPKAYRCRDRSTGEVFLEGVPDK